jgi:hypothetical protein
VRVGLSCKPRRLIAPIAGSCRKAAPPRTLGDCTVRDGEDESRTDLRFSRLLTRRREEDRILFSDGMGQRFAETRWREAPDPRKAAA